MKTGRNFTMKHRQIVRNIATTLIDRVVSVKVCFSGRRTCEALPIVRWQALR